MGELVLTFAEVFARGWQRHDGGECPIDPESVAAMVFRDGQYVVRKAGDEEWEWEDETPNSDIVAYCQI